MAAGINLTPNVKVYLGEIKEQLLRDLDNDKVKYNVMFNKLNDEGVKETILHLRDISTEIIVKNDIVSYIKSDNNEFSHMDTIPDISNDTLTHVKYIKGVIEEKFRADGYNVKIEKIDTRTMNMTVILTSETEKIRIQILRDTLGEVYINTMLRI